MTLVQGEQSRSPRHSTLAAAVSRIAALSVPGCGSVHLQHFHASRRATSILKPGNSGSKTLRQKAGKYCSHNYLSNSKKLFVFALLCAEAQTGREVKVILFFLPLDPASFGTTAKGSLSCRWAVPSPPQPPQSQSQGKNTGAATTSNLAAARGGSASALTLRLGLRLWPARGVHHARGLLLLAAGACACGSG